MHMFILIKLCWRHTCCNYLGMMLHDAICTCALEHVHTNINVWQQNHTHTHTMPQKPQTQCVWPCLMISALLTYVHRTLQRRGRNHSYHHSYHHACHHRKGRFSRENREWSHHCHHTMLIIPNMIFLQRNPWRNADDSLMTWGCQIRWRVTFWT